MTKKVEMNLTLIISGNCEACERAKQLLLKMKLENPNIKTNIIDRKIFKRNIIQITPALFINDELFSYGDIDEVRLLNKIN